MWIASSRRVSETVYVYDNKVPISLFSVHNIQVTLIAKHELAKG